MNALSQTVREMSQGVRPDAWKVLIVDDEPEVHAVTQLVLGDMRFADQPLQFLNAYSAGEAENLLREHPDIAVMLLDVVMESERAGLELVRTVREAMGNHFVRIVLRTGEPGQAPEQQVIANYDINDYREKTELTAQRLTTTMYAALRGYRDMRTVEANRRGLERVINASSYIFSHEQSEHFADEVLRQLATLFEERHNALYCSLPGTRIASSVPLPVTAAVGDYRYLIGQDAAENLAPAIVASMRTALSRRHHVFTPDHYVLCLSDNHAERTLVYVGQTDKASEPINRLIEVLSANVSIAFENLHLNREVLDSQLEMIHMLAGAAETRSYETANHVKRVGLLAELLGKLYGLDEKLTTALRLASPLHDIGKIGIPDAILNKAGEHTPEEAAIMRTHAELGAALLSRSQRPLLQLAAEIAHTHHENWDGSGYPRGLTGESIPISGRITMLADVFDALGSSRCYKRPWENERIHTFLIEQSGKKFEPRLVELLVTNWQRIQEVRTQLPD